MQVRILKLWRSWGWLFYLAAWLISGTVMLTTYGQATASNTVDISFIKKQHDDENLATRMAVQEQLAKDIRDNVLDIKTAQGAILNRMNQIADRGKQ